VIELVAQEKANKQPGVGVIYSGGSIRKDLRRRTIQGQYVLTVLMGPDQPIS
jgi:hypothetical protein